MLFLLTSRTRPGLSAEQYRELGALAKAFYASIPEGMHIRGRMGRGRSIGELFAAWRRRDEAVRSSRPGSVRAIHRDADRAGGGHCRLDVLVAPAAVPTWSALGGECHAQVIGH